MKPETLNPKPLMFRRCLLYCTMVQAIDAGTSAFFGEVCLVFGMRALQWRVPA